MAQQLATIDLVAPATQGLNREARNRLLPPEYATKLKNWRLNKEGLLASRLGQTDVTTTAIGSTPNILQMHEYIDTAANTEIILSWDGGIANDIDNPAGNDVSGSLTDADGNWWFQNFNGKCLAFQSGQKLAVYSGSTFATVTESSGTAPSSGIAGCVFGRVWQVDASDAASLLYSNLLDETDWGGTGAGDFDLNGVWLNGTDHITAVVGFNGALVVFGMNHIVFIVDGSGSELGLNPASAYVADVIAGTGCVDQNTIQHIGESDLLFLSPNGVQSLARTIQEKSNPLETVSRAIHTDLMTTYRAETAGQIRSTFNPDEGLYILTFPGQGKSYAFDVRRPYASATTGTRLLPIFEWDLAPWSWVSRENGTLLMGGAGNVYSYSGTTDNGTNISVEYESPWLDLGEEVGNRLKMLKKLGATIFTSLDGNVVYKWGKDFNTTFDSYTDTLTAPVGAAEWGVAKWNEDEWSGALGISITRVPARAKAQYFKVGISSSINTSFVIQQIELLAKIGRLA